MVNVRAYRYYNRMIVHFFDSGCKDELCCPECSWKGNPEHTALAHATEPAAIDCPQCTHPLGIVTQPVTELVDIPAFL